METFLYLQLCYMQVNCVPFLEYREKTSRFQFGYCSMIKNKMKQRQERAGKGREELRSVFPSLCV